MFQPHAEQPGVRAIFHCLRTGGLWLAHLGLFAGLRWLAAQLPPEPVAVAVAMTQTTAPQAPRAPPEKPLPARVPAVKQPEPPRAPDLSPDDGCPGPGLGEGENSDVIPFGETMTRPELISGEPLQPTPEARAAGVRGLIIARCIITCQGVVKDCQLLKSLPHMEQATIANLESRRYRPVRFRGVPVTVRYAFSLRLDPP